MDITNALDSLLGAINFAGKSTEQTKTTLKLNESALQSSYQQEQLLAASQAANAEVIARTVQSGILTREQADTKSAILNGVDTGDISGRQLEAAEDLRAAQIARKESLAAIKQKESVSVFDDPIAWITNQFTINDDIDKHNAANAAAADATKRVAENNAVFSAQHQSLLAQQTTVNAASVEASVNQAGNALRLQEELSKRNAILSATGTAEKINSLTVSQAQLKTAAYSAVQQQEHLIIAQKQLQLSVDNAAERKADKAATMEDALAEVARINLGFKVKSSSNPRVIEVNSPAGQKMLRDFMKGKAPLDPDMLYAYQLGALNEGVDPTGKARILGTSPSKTLGMLKATDVELAPDQKFAVQILRDAEDSVQLTAAYKIAKAAKDVPTMTKLYDDEAKRIYMDHMRNTTDPNSVGYLPGMASIIGMIPFTAQTDLYKKVLMEPIKAGVDVSTPSQVYNLGVEAVRRGTMKLDDFVKDYTAIYRQAQELNQASKQTGSMGLPAISSYVTDLRTGGLFDQKIDNTDPIAVKRAVNLQLAREFRQTVIPHMR